MLRFIYTRHELPTLQTPFSLPFKIESAAPFVNKALPMSHLYVTSNHYADYINSALGESFQGMLEELSPEYRHRLLKHVDFPVDFKNRQFKSVSELRSAITQVVGERTEINIVIVNGIGNGLGDNYIGLAALQRFTNLLAPTKVNFHLMQELDQRIKPVYVNQRNVTLHCNVMPVSEFMMMDFYIDLDGVENMPDFDHVPAAHFNAHAFSINQLVPSNNLQPLLNINVEEAKKFKRIISASITRERPVVLLHPLSSSPLRTLPPQKTAELTKALIRQGFNVVSLFHYDKPPEGFVSLADHCDSINDVLHVVHEVDGVVSVGTVIYHLAAALSKPTILLPTVTADVRSAQLLPEVLTWLPSVSESLVQNLHKSDDPKHLSIADGIWCNLDFDALAEATRTHIESFVLSEAGHMVAPTAPERIAVIVLHTHNLEQLTICLDALVTVNGVDPLRLQCQSICDGLDKSLQQQAELAINNGCDLIWVLNSKTKVTPDYLLNALAQFDQDPKLRCIGDAIFQMNKSALPHDVGDVELSMINYDIDSFSSSLIRVGKVES